MEYKIRILASRHAHEVHTKDEGSQSLRYETRETFASAEIDGVSVKIELKRSIKQGLKTQHAGTGSASKLADPDNRWVWSFASVKDEDGRSLYECDGPAMCELGLLIASMEGGSTLETTLPTALILGLAEHRLSRRKYEVSEA